MANLFAQNTANWDSANMWNTAANGSGSFVTPGSGDVCMANNKTVTVNISPTVAEVRHDTTGGATAGGSFALSNGVTLTANIYGHTGTGCVSFAGTGTAYVVGNVTAVGANGIYHTGTGAITITGNVLGSATANANGLYDGSSGVANISGSVAAGAYVNTANGIISTSTATLNVTGAVTGAIGKGISNDSSGIANVTGTVTAGTAQGILSAAVGKANVTGPLIASSTYQQPIQGPWRFLSAMTASYLEVYDTANVKRTLYTTNYEVGGLPLAANVRSGTVFGPASELTGTLAVPPAGSVSLGVPVDNTTGTLTSDAASVAAAVWGTLVADLDTANSIGARLAQAATVPSTGAQIAALGV